MHPELLLDIAKLIRKYPPQVWEEFLHQLRDPRFMDEVLYAAREMGRLSHESRVNPRQGGLRSDDDIFFRRALLLDQVRADLIRRRISEVRAYAESLGISFTGKTSREALVRRVLEALAKKDVEEIERSRTPTLFGRPVTEDYERWGELIMGKRIKPKS